ncbi:MAG: hypothetical protein J6W02_04765 [Bacteroidaceae bacterium]|nr:hypothetical protein [Bacteroidaceae bacterium]MBO7557101.1 hypothetical protein [Bacteroidaceae bacterium]
MKQFDINNQSKRNPFTVPDGYFENLTARVMANIPEVETEEKVSENNAKIVSMEPRKSSRKWMGWSIAAAACIAVAALFITIPNKTDGVGVNQMAQTETSNSYDSEYQEEMLEYAMVDNTDIYNYLAGVM